MKELLNSYKCSNAFKITYWRSTYWSQPCHGKSLLHPTASLISFFFFWGFFFRLLGANGCRKRGLVSVHWAPVSRQLALSSRDTDRGGVMGIMRIKQNFLPFILKVICSFLFFFHVFGVHGTHITIAIVFIVLTMLTSNVYSFAHLLYTLYPG